MRPASLQRRLRSAGRAWWSMGVDSVAPEPERPLSVSSPTTISGVSAMDKDRIAGSAKDVAGKVEGAVGDIAGDAQAQAAGRAREAEGTVQNLYGQAKDTARDATDAAV